MSSKLEGQLQILNGIQSEWAAMLESAVGIPFNRIDQYTKATGLIAEGIQEGALKSIYGEAYDGVKLALGQNYPDNCAFTEALTYVASLQMDAIQQSLLSVNAPALNAFASAVERFDFEGGLEQYSEALSERTIASADIAALKLNSGLLDAVEDALPCGMKTTIKNLNLSAAKQLAKVKGLGYKQDDRTFYSENSPDVTATIKEANVLCGAIAILPDIDMNDLVEFMNYLVSDPYHAGTHRVGKLISQLVFDWPEVTLLDDKCHYYHGRVMDENGAPFLNNEMGNAPTRMPGQGRFNSPGQSYYYVADTEHGAVMESRRHCRSGKLQVAKMEVVNDAKIVDLSIDARDNRFLNHCRLQYNEKDVASIHREYLIPCFVSQCCRDRGVDGIKYYGSKEYANFVFWKPSHFRVLSCSFP